VIRPRQKLEGKAAIAKYAGSSYSVRDQFGFYTFKVSNIAT